MHATTDPTPWPRTALQLGASVVAVALAGYGLALFLGAQFEAAHRIDSQAIHFVNDPIYQANIFQHLGWTTLTVLLAVGATVAARRPVRAALAETVFAAALAWLPLALLPSVLWYDHIPGRSLLAAALVGWATWRACRVVDELPFDAERLHRLLDSTRFAAALAVFAALLLFYGAWIRHASHWSSLIDLGLFYELFDNAAGRPLYSPTLGMSFLGEHFSPVLYLLVPLLWLFPDPLTLLAIQAASIAGGGFLLYLWARDRVGHGGFALALMFAWCFCPYVQQAAFYDFHMDMLEAPMLFGLVLALHRGRLLWVWICAVLLWCTKEDTFIYTSVIAVYAMITERRFKLGAALLVVGLVQAGLVLGVLLPAMRPPHDPAHFSTTGDVKGYAFLLRYRGLGEGTSEVARTLLLNPFAWIGNILSGAKLTSVLALLLTFGPTTVTGRWALLLLIPTLEILLGDMMGMFVFYYGAIVIPFAAMAAVEGARRVRQAPPVWWTPRFGALAVALLVGSLALWRWHPASLAASHSDHKNYVRTPHQQAAEALIDTIPDGASVAATGYLAVHAQPGRDVSMFPYALDQAEYVLIDLQRPAWPSSRAGVQDHLVRLVRGGEFAVEASGRDGLVLLRRQDRATRQGDGGLAALTDDLRQPILEPELSEQTAFPHRAVADDEASNGAYVSVPGWDSRGPGHLVYGPSMRLPAGTYRATFRLRWENDVGGDYPGDRLAATLDVFSRHGQSVHASQDLTVDQLAATAGQWQDLALEFRAPTTLGDVELRVFYHDLGRLDLDVIELEAVDTP